jgi:hypothetical protein
MEEAKPAPVALPAEAPKENKEMMTMIRDLAKDHPALALIAAIVMGLGFPTGMGFFGAEKGAQSVLDKVQDHEVRITGAEREIIELKATSKEHRDMMRDIREHMIIQTEHVKVIQRDLAEIKASK